MRTDTHHIELEATLEQLLLDLRRDTVETDMAAREDRILRRGGCACSGSHRGYESRSVLGVKVRGSEEKKTDSRSGSSRTDTTKRKEGQERNQEDQSPVSSQTPGRSSGRLLPLIVVALVRGPGMV